MPYIKPEDRPRASYAPATPGELNFAVSRLVVRYIDRLEIPLSYQIINDIIGALEGAKAEFYRRVVAPYEDKKAGENGDVYGAYAG
jgi:hypothetical protein